VYQLQERSCSTTDCGLTISLSKEGPILLITIMYCVHSTQYSLLVVIQICLIFVSWKAKRKWRLSGSVAEIMGGTWNRAVVQQLSLRLSFYIEVATTRFVHIENDFGIRLHFTMHGSLTIICCCPIAVRLKAPSTIDAPVFATPRALRLFAFTALNVLMCLQEEANHSLTHSCDATELYTMDIAVGGPYSDCYGTEPTTMMNYAEITAQI